MILLLRSRTGPDPHRTYFASLHLHNSWHDGPHVGRVRRPGRQRATARYAVAASRRLAGCALALAAWDGGPRGQSRPYVSRPRGPPERTRDATRARRKKPAGPATDAPDGRLVPLGRLGDFQEKTEGPAAMCCCGPSAGNAKSDSKRCAGVAAVAACGIMIVGMAGCGRLVSSARGRNPRASFRWWSESFHAAHSIRRRGSPSIGVIRG